MIAGNQLACVVYGLHKKSGVVNTVFRSIQSRTPTTDIQTTIMTDKQTQAFYEELGKLLGKYNLRGMVGLYFEQTDHSVMQLYNVTDQEMKRITNQTAAILRDLHRKTTGQLPDETRGYVSGEDGKKN
jgi:hypothetical protein